MKTKTLTTIAIIVLSCMLNITNVFCIGGDNTYRNEVMDENTRTLTVVLSSGSNGTNLVPTKKYTTQFDEANNPIEKITYNFDRSNNWSPSQKYVYTYNDNGKMSTLSLLTWDANSKTWKEEKTTTFSADENNLYTNTENSVQKSDKL